MKEKGCRLIIIAEFDKTTLNLIQTFLLPRPKVSLPLYHIFDYLLFSQDNPFIQIMDLMEDSYSTHFRNYNKYPPYIHIAFKESKKSLSGCEITPFSFRCLKQRLEDRGRYLPFGIKKLWKVQGLSCISKEENILTYSNITEIKDVRQRYS